MQFVLIQFHDIFALKQTSLQKFPFYEKKLDVLVQDMSMIEWTEC